MDVTSAPFLDAASRVALEAEDKEGEPATGSHPTQTLRLARYMLAPPITPHSAAHRVRRVSASFLSTDSPDSVCG